MHKLDLGCMTQENDKITFKFDPLKQSRPSVKSPIMELCAYPENPKTCVVKTLSYYLERTQSFREQETKLFLTYQKPHHAVSASTISRSIKSLLKQAGVDPSKFGAHSTRAASFCAGKKGGVPIMDILSTGGWSSERTFVRKLFVTLKPGNFLLICLSSFHSYLWFWLFVKVTCRYTYTGWVVIKELYCCIDISSLYLSCLQNLT